MSDSTDTVDAESDGAEDTQTEAPSVHCHAQYIKDMSFENPNALNASNDDGIAPDVDMNIRLGVETVNDDVYEVTLTVEGKATRNGKHLFMVELDYAGLYSVRNIPTEHVESVLFVHCPTLLFPFARQIIAEVTSNGGYPPLLLNAVDFATMYQQQHAAAQDDAGTKVESGTA